MAFSNMAASWWKTRIITNGQTLTYTYDANGNMLARVELTGTQRITYTHGWDAENRLIAVTNTQTLSATRFVYDGDGVRVAQVAPDGTTTVYIGEIYEEMLPPGTSVGGGAGGSLPRLGSLWNDWLVAGGLRYVRDAASGAYTPPAGRNANRLASAQSSPLAQSGTWYTYTDEFNTLDTNYWSVSTANGATLQAVGGAVQARRGWYTDTTWVIPASIDLRPRVSLLGNGTIVKWRFRINPNAQWMTAYGMVDDPEAQRNIGLECSLGNLGSTLHCIARLRSWNPDVEYMAYFFDLTPDQLGVYHTFEIRNPAARQIAYYLDGNLLASKTFSSAEWNDFDWGTVRWYVIGWPEWATTPPHRNNRIDADLDRVEFTSYDDSAPSLSLGGPTPGVWYTGTSPITYTVGDGGSGPRCLRAQWDSWPVNDGSCFVTSGSTTHPGEGVRTLYLRAWDWAGLQTTAPYTYYRDNTAPIGVATSTLTTTDLNLWPITATVSESGGSGVERARLYFRFGTSGSWNAYQSDDTSSPYAWTFTPYDGEGAYQFCAWARDVAGNEDAACGAAELTITYNTDAPEVRIASLTAGLYAYVVGSSVYYNGNQTGSFIVTARVTNTGGGLQYLRFPDTTSTGVLSNVTANGLYSWGYTFDPNDNLSYMVEVTAANSANKYQAAPFSVIRDALAPSVVVTAATKVVSGVIPVAWSASESGSGLTGVYTVSVMTDTGPLQVWQGSTTATSATFTPAFGHRYTFVVSATDWVSNTGQSTAATDAIQVTKYYYLGSSRVAMRRSTATGSEVTYLHADHLGTVSLATNASQAVLARKLNMPYGSVRWASGTMPTDYGFTGMKDTGLGLVYLHARYYSSWVGRFVSADTIVPGPENPQAFNRYAYTLNNPVKYTDPTGHFSEDELINKFHVFPGPNSVQWVKDHPYSSAFFWYWILRAADSGDEVSLFTMEFQDFSITAGGDPFMQGRFEARDDSLMFITSGGAEFRVRDRGLEDVNNPGHGYYINVNWLSKSDGSVLDSSDSARRYVQLREAGGLRGLDDDDYYEVNISGYAIGGGGVTIKVDRYGRIYLTLSLGAGLGGGVTANAGHFNTDYVPDEAELRGYMSGLSMSAGGAAVSTLGGSKPAEGPLAAERGVTPSVALGLYLTVDWTFQIR